jgi:two-component system, NarL family, nitrate/nitrite response regulator NarL
MRILIISTSRLFRDGLARLLEDDDGVEVLESATPGTLLPLRLGAHAADVAVVDLGSDDGIPEAPRLLAMAPELKVIGVNAGESEGEVLAWAEAGVVGCVPRDGTVADLRAALDTVARGEVVCPPRIAAVLMRRVAHLANYRDDPARAAQLTARQREILNLIERGFSNKQIARELCIELATVKNHVHAILGRLQVERRDDAATYARRSRMAAGLRP